MKVKQRECWHSQFNSIGITYLFFLAFEEQLILDGEASRLKKEEDSVQDEAPLLDDDDDKEKGKDKQKYYSNIPTEKAEKHHQM